MSRDSVVYIKKYDENMSYNGENGTEVGYRADLLYGNKDETNFLGMVEIGEHSREETKRHILSNIESAETRSKAFEQPYEQEDYSDRYNTQLSDEEETEYQKWAKENGKAKDVFDYDMRGFWKEMKSGTASMDERGHASDKYKKPNHPTFSNESIYASEGIPGYWEKNKNGTMVYHAPKNIGKGQQAWLSEYFKNNEKGVGLAFENDIVMENEHPFDRERQKETLNTPIDAEMPVKGNSWIKTTGKAIASVPVNLGSAISKGAVKGLTDLGIWVAEKVQGEELPAPFKSAAEQELDHVINHYHQLLWGDLERITGASKRDNSILYNTVGLGSSIITSWGIGGVFKSLWAGAAIFGLSSGTSTYTYARENGVSPIKALGYSVPVALGVAVSERAGLENLARAFTIKSLKNAGIKIIGINAAVEGGTEAFQTGIESGTNMLIDGSNDIAGLVLEMVESFIYGSLAAPISGGVVLASTKDIRKEFAKRFQAKGLGKMESEQLAQALVLDKDQLCNELKELTENEIKALQEMSDERKSAVFKSNQQALMDIMMQAKGDALSDKNQAIVDENAQKIKERAIAEGLSEEEAEDAAKLGSNLLKNTLSLATELGVTEEQIAEDFNFDITNAEDTQEKVAYTDEEGRIIGDEVIPLEEDVEEISIDDEQRAIAEYKMEQEVASLVAEGKSEEEARAIVEKEYFKEQYFLRLIAEGKSEEEARAVIEKEELIEQEVARLMAEGKSEKDARFIVAEGREPTDADRAAGYNYIPYQTEEYIRVDEPVDLHPYETLKSGAIKNLQEEYDNIPVWNEEHKAEIEQAEKEYLQKEQEWKQAKKDKIAELQKLADNNPNAEYIREAQIPNVTVEDLHQGKIKGKINSAKKKWSLEDILTSGYYLSKEVKEYLEGEQPVRILEAKSDWDITRKGKKLFENTYLGKKGKTPFSDAEIKDGKVSVTSDFIESEPILKEIRSVLKKDGWEPYHTSGKRVGSSSSYYRKNGYTLRLSNHELPMTAERQYNTDMGFRHGWDFEYILDSHRDMLDYYAVPTKEDFRKLFYKKSGIAEEYNEKIDYEQSKGGEARYQAEEFTEEENQALEIMNNPDREQIVANMSEEERRNFTALEQSVKNKELYNQSIDLQKEMNEIDRAEFDAGVPMWDKDTIEINGVERAVTNSSGKKIAHSEKSLRMFYEWFGDSKAVNEKGEPINLYHGTRFDFSAFDGTKPIFLSDNRDVAVWFAIYGKGNSAGNIKTVYAKLENPLVIDAKGNMFGDIDFEGYRFNAETIASIAKERGYDGLIINNVKEAGYEEILSNDYVAFSPNQIKSTSNTGTFSKASDDIRYQTGGDIASRPYSNKQVEKMLENWQDNEDALLDLYDNHLGKYNNTIAGRIRFAAVWDLKKREYKPTPNEEAQREREVIKTEQANLKLPKKITLETLKKVIKDNGYTVIGEYTANTGSQYITVETDGETQDEIRISIRDHKRHSADYVRPDYDLLVEYDNSWQDRFEDIINRLNLKGAFVTKVKKYNELSRKLRGETQSKAELDARYQTEAEEKNLVVTHGTTLEKLEEALRLGAMPMPSLAVTKSELATGDQYGEITFVGGYDIINPNKDKANKTFAADIYSPRREKPEYELNSDGIEYIKRQTGNVSKKGDSYWTSNIEYALNNEQDYLLKEVYLASIGKISDLDGSTYSIVWEMTDKQKDDFKKWKNKLINEYTDKKIFKGVTPSGNRKYVPYDLKNILQELKQKALRGSEEGMGGTAHALRGVWADELKNIEEIRKRKDKLVDEETYKKLDNIIWDETAKLTDLLVSEKLAEDLANDLVNPEEYMIEEALKLIKPSSDIANILAKADLRSDKKAVDAVKKYMTLLKNTPVKYFESKPARAVDFSEFEGVLIPSDAEYDAVARELEEQGVKQVLRYGSKEEKNQLINRMQKVFFQTSGDGGERKPLKPYKRNPLKVLGQYEPTKKMITLFKGRNPTTLIHEMGHHYLPIQLRMLEKAGKWDKLKPLYKELGISSVENMGRDAEEKLIDMFTSYIFYNEAPNVETQSIFERAKQWMISAYNTVKNFVKPSEEVTKFFDELIAGEENAPDISHLVGKEAELSKILQGARHGQELTINGLSMKDIAILRQALHARVPRRGRSLADVIRKAGGIDSRSEIAKALGYDSRKGGEMGFWNYRGTIDNEQALIELLVAEGFLFDVEQDSAEGVQAVWNKVERLINNRDTIFSEAEQLQNEKREQAYKVQEMVNNILVKHYNKDIKTLEEDMKAVTKKLADIGAVAVDKATLEYLQNSLAKMSKDYRKLLSEKKEKQYKYQEELTKFIKSSPLNNKDKLKLIDKIRMVKDERTYEKYLGEAKSQIEKYVEAESKRVLDELIQKEIKSSKPRKVMAQLYDYANNKLFADLREWNKLNQTEAEIKADQLDEAIAKGNGELSRTDKLRRMFLEYKSFGKDCSVEFMQALHDEIKAAKQAGIDAKDDLDFKRAFEREQDREAILEKIKESNFDKNSFIGKVVNAYRNGISNLYSMLNSLVGKEIAEKFQFETIVENKQVKEWKHLKETNQKAQKIYGVKSYGELLNLMADKGKKMFTIYKKKDTESFEGSLSDDFYHELSVLDLIDIYNSMKNIKTSDDYAKAYGIEQINALLANLTEQDKAFADMLMEDVNSRYKAINKVYINLYGMDLKRVDNYWMSSTEHSTPIDVLNDMRMQSTTPGFFKERTSGSVIPLPKNAWLKYQNHIAQGYYMTEVAEKFKEMTEVFKSKRIENIITNKFGEKVYKTLIDQIEAIGLNASPASVDDMSKWYNKLVSNWVGAKIALNPVVFVGQLTSFTNYAVDVPTKAYLKNFMYALRHPKEVFDFMMKHNKDFLMHRYESGFNEAMSRFITQAESLNSMKFGLSPKSKFGWANILSSLVRMGDMGSLIFGGYGQFKTMLDNGMSVEEAKKKFEFATLRSQQSGNAASIAKIQRVPNGLSMLFLPFKNTAMQYGRKIVDTVVSYQNGDITKAQATKTLTNYLFIQPALWVFIRNIAKDILGLDDEDDEYTDGILEQILVNPIEMIPFAGESFKAVYSIIADEKLYGVYSMPLFDDIEKSWRKLAKEEKDIFDWVDIISPVVEGLTATPIQTPKRYAQKWFGEE